MCERDMFTGAAPVSRRAFGALGVGGTMAAGLSACTGMNMGGGSNAALLDESVSFEAPGGTMDGYFVRPTSGKHPGVILWPDIAGLREAKRVMARRLAEAGYAVLVTNPYYRSVAGEQFADFDAFRSSGGFDTVKPWRANNTPEAVMQTARAVVDWLDAHDSVDASKGIGNQGYCMTGSWTVFTAAARPDRVRAAASFHGGGLVTGDAMSPHKLLGQTAPDARLLFAIARDDDAEAPGDKGALRAALDAANRAGEVEVYAGDHGWTVLDSPAYDQPAAEKAWGRLLATYNAAL